MKVFIGARTDPGQRANNEDAHAVVNGARSAINADSILLIADGMGGRSFGEAASAMAISTVQSTLAELLGTSQSAPVTVPDALSAALRKANSQVYAGAQDDPARKGMGATCVAAVISGTDLFLGHVGDSRAYLLGDSGLEQLTDDHSFVADQVRAGAITEDKARTSRFRNVITRAIGIEPTINPDLEQYDIHSAEALLLCTDGLTNAVSDAAILQILRNANSAQAAADQLVDAALQNGGKDNITVVVARFGADQTIRAAADTLPQAPVSRQPDAGTAPTPSTRVRRRHLGPWVTLFAVLWILTSIAAVYLGSVLYAGGYHIAHAAPFVVKPAPPKPPPPLDYAALTYAAPRPYATAPLVGQFLAIHADGTATVATRKGHLAVLDSQGQPVRVYPVPKSALPLFAPDDTKHTFYAQDPQGNTYVSDPAHHRIMKLAADGRALPDIATGALQHPEALQIAADGTVYVLDAQRLLAIPPKVRTR